MKQCNYCHEEKPYTEFNRKRATKDGYQPRCRPCVLESRSNPEYRSQVKAREATPERRAKNLAYSRLPHVVAQQAEYDKSPKAKEARRKRDNTEQSRAKAKARRADPEYRANMNQKARERYTLNTIKRAPHNAVAVAINRGELAKASDTPCAKEGPDCSGIHHYHHSSYAEDQWLVVTCYCRRHHAEWHRNNEVLV
jgi:hypothetical protein